MFDPHDLPLNKKLSYYLGKYDGLDAAEFFCRHACECNPEQKQFLQEVADELRNRKLVVRENYEIAAQLGETQKV